MAYSAGLRSIKPIIRFIDEFGSIGSNPTPRAMERKVYRDLFECCEENSLLTNLATYDCPEFVRNCTSCDKRGVSRTSIRNHYFAGFFAKVADPRYLAGVDKCALQVLAYYAPYYMNSCLSMNSQVRPAEAHNELFSRRTYEGVPIHAVRLAECVDKVAKAVYLDFYNIHVCPDTTSMFHAVHRRLLNDPKLIKCFSSGMLKVLAEGVMM